VAHATQNRQYQGDCGLRAGRRYSFPEGTSPRRGQDTDPIEKNGGHRSIYVRLYEIYGNPDNRLLRRNERPELYEWTRRLHLMRKWAALLNKHGGDVTVIHLPEIGLYGNTHFPFSDLNNVEVANHLSKWLHEKGLD